MKGKLPLFYFSPTICWVDDDQLFLDAIRFKFAEKYEILTFHNPHEALQFFSSYESPLANITFKHDVTNSELYGTDNHCPINVQLSNIMKVAALSDKTNELALLIVDQNMPGINGIEVFKKMKDAPMKKILLTGEVGGNLAIEAFNAGLIDKFINKDANMSENLQAYIDDLIYQYFYKKTEHLISDLEASTPSVVTDPIFVDFFNQWCIENQIIEFYMLNKNGSFWVKNRSDQVSCFVVMSETNLKDFIGLTDELFETDPGLLGALKAGEKIPFFGFDKEYWQIQPEAWVSCFYSCQLLNGREPYYWAVIN